MLYYDYGMTSFSSMDSLSSTKKIYCSTDQIESIGASPSYYYFQPKAIRFSWLTGGGGIYANDPVILTDLDLYKGIGFATSTTSRACVTAYSATLTATSDTGSGWSNTSCVMLVSGSGTTKGKLDINSIDTDGFTLIVDEVNVGGPTVQVFWEAWGGPDITNVTIGAIAEPGAIGNVNYTATGFVTNPSGNDQCVMLAGVQTVNATDVAAQQDSGLYIGFATSPSTANNIVIVGNSDDASATSDTDGYNYTGECVAMITIAGGATNARARLQSFGTDIFTLNWLERTTNNRRSIYMAIKGGGWRAGSTTINSNTLNSTATVSSLPFNMRGGLFMSSETITSTADTSRTEDKMSLGKAKLITDDNVSSYRYRQSSTFYQDKDALTNSGIITTSFVLSENALDYVLYFTGSGATSLETAHSITSMDANQFTITCVAGASGVANEWIGYLAFGDRNSMTGVGHPFII